MKLYYRDKRTPYVPEGMQVFHGDAPQQTPKKRTVFWIVTSVAVLAIVIGAGLMLGRMWSTRDDNFDAAEKAASEQRVNQSPQDTVSPQQSNSAVPAVDGGVNQTSPTN